ncbi:amino acid permease [Saccharopolyspora hordei]|uniref:AAT family amino acid transporter/D-serine/D-alanine/glycine transporter n=1 Tax=Saccharopolyspora hordei TaxID=1838 RepID=A0A853AFW4_9PSEU|nr:amino acid permease [Saccharopolyspora hordei]NYI83464.1 AAT family amino acid transporter/D-serine/D-alanine/glycine transporter [Saccharopolyspora hordei]
MSQPATEEYRKDLSTRHINMIAIGGAIGVGLFLGSGKALHQVGPGLILNYAIAGLMIFFVMRALGELLMYRPVSGSFAEYAGEFVGPWARFAVGWGYWLVWIVTGMAEITAVGQYFQFWFPEVPQWIPALCALVVLSGVNLIAVKLFGEFEFWFALIKVVAIIGLIVLAALILVFGFSDVGPTASLSNIWSHGGFFPNGGISALLAFQIVMFAFIGVEMVGQTASESSNPTKVLPRAINAVMWRILIFYVGALVALTALVPWFEFPADGSPFVHAFTLIGIPAAAGVVNFVVTTAALSSCNSGIYSTGRMIRTLALDGQAPRAVARLSGRAVPARAIAVTFCVMLIGVVLNYFVPEQAFTYITSASTVGAIFTWAMILIAHLGYRRKVARGDLPAGTFRMPFAPWSNYVVLAFLALVVVLLAFDEETRIALYITPVLVVAVVVGYLASRKRQQERQHTPVG